MKLAKLLRLEVKRLAAKREAVDRELGAITTALGALDGRVRKGLRRGRRPGRPPGHKMSAATRRKISIAQKLRWQKAK